MVRCATAHREHRRFGAVGALSGTATRSESSWVVIADKGGLQHTERAHTMQFLSFLRSIPSWKNPFTHEQTIFTVDCLVSRSNSLRSDLSSHVSYGEQCLRRECSSSVIIAVHLRNMHSTQLCRKCGLCGAHALDSRRSNPATCPSGGRQPHSRAKSGSMKRRCGPRELARPSRGRRPAAPRELLTVGRLHILAGVDSGS